MRIPIALALFTLLAGCPRSGPESPQKLSRTGESCTRTADCEGDLRCVGLVCVDPAAAPPAAKTPVVRPAEGTAPVAAKPAEPAAPPPDAGPAPAPDVQPAPAPPERSKLIPADKKYLNCKEMRPVTGGDDSTAEGALYRAFEALLLDDDEKAFGAFYALIDQDFQREVDARRYWFGSARKHGGKNFQRLVFGPKNPSYVVCEVREEASALRIFVGKSPPVGSNPPFVLHRIGERWRLKNFTPH